MREAKWKRGVGQHGEGKWNVGVEREDGVEGRVVKGEKGVRWVCKEM